MRGLIEALLALTRGDEGAPLDIGRYDLDAVVREAVQGARAAADGKVSIECLPAGNKAEATFDRNQVRRAAAILLDNAVKYTPEGGTVTVRVGEKDGRASVEVSDTGIGIAEDEMPLIFERFHRADPSRSEDGAGLGLSIARQIAEAHDGTIDVRSEVGKGATFTFFLPKPREVEHPAPYG